ncbi:MFS transporter [Pectobacterium actinidiae]|uniref:MFS transporter n=1 Tax=Pectobacterium actinidiae TaxID=1507808 RepID=UPI0037F2362A
MKSNKYLFCIALGLFGVFTVEFSVIGLLPSIVDRYGVTVAQAGSLVGWFAAVAAIGGPVMVLWLSRYDRKFVLVASLLIFSLCSVLSAWAPNFESLMALRVVPGLFLPVLFSLAFAAAVALYPPERAAHATSMALMGESVGLVFGVPIIIFLESWLSYEASFLFCASVCALAAAGLCMLPKGIKNTHHTEGSNALIILKNPVLWLGLIATVAVLSAMFSVYSYATQYLSKMGIDNDSISVLMMVFGIGGLFGNFIAGQSLAKNIRLTVILYPIVLGASYLILHIFATPTFFAMAVLCAAWGGAHTSGLVVSQFWVASSAREAPEFATSLFVSAANLGVTLGAAAGGAFITRMGMNGPIWAGWMFSIMALVFFAASVGYARRQQRFADAAC